MTQVLPTRLHQVQERRTSSTHQPPQGSPGTFWPWQNANVHHVISSFPASYCRGLRQISPAACQFSGDVWPDWHDLRVRGSCKLLLLIGQSGCVDTLSVTHLVRPHPACGRANGRRRQAPSHPEGKDVGVRDAAVSGRVNVRYTRSVVHEYVGKDNSNKLPGVLATTKE